jgi:hypothetical protein
LSGGRRTNLCIIKDAKGKMLSAVTAYRGQARKISVAIATTATASADSPSAQ